MRNMFYFHSFYVCVAVIAVFTFAIITGLGTGFARAQRVQSSLAGNWSGTLYTSAGSLPLMIHVNGAPGSWTGTLDSPSQHAAGLELVVEQVGDQIVFTLVAAQATFRGKLSGDGAKIVGIWTQSGNDLPLTLTHTISSSQSSPELRRPQEPHPPFPYRVEDVAYENVAGHSHLAGTLTLPEGVGPFPVVLLITGSGLQDRDETIFAHKPFLLWADTLTRLGVAVLRVDDRSVGQSTGDVSSATTADFATDVEAGIAYLRSRADIDPRRIGLMGHSEGGTIASLVAARDSSIAFIVLLSSSGEDGETLLLSQKRLIERSMGIPTNKIDESITNTRFLEDAVKYAPDQATAEARLSDAFRNILAQQGAPQNTPVPPNVRTLAQPWMRWFLAYDPGPTLAQVHCPILAVGGSKDQQVPAKDNLDAIKRAAPQSTVVEIPNLNHLLQTAVTGDVNEYSQIEETISPIVLRLVSEWVTAHAVKPLE